jgi:hypothetical protein
VIFSAESSAFIHTRNEPDAAKAKGFSDEDIDVLVAELNAIMQQKT